MAYDVVIQNAEGIVEVTLNGSVKRGDLLAHNGTNFVQAAASDAATNLYAQYVAMTGGESGQVIPACRKCVLYDEDASSYTANTTQYLSGTAGAVTETRPATDGDVIQIVGRSTDTYHAFIDILRPREVEVFIPANEYNLQNTGTAIEARTTDGTTNEWMGADVDGAYLAGIFTGFFPSGLVGAPLAADVLINTQASTAVDIDVTYIRAYVNGANTGDAGATKTALSTTETTADNEVQKVSILTGMDADFVKAGAPFAVAIDPDAGDFLLLGLYMRYLVV